MNQPSYQFIISVAICLTLATGTSFARGGDHPSHIPDKPATAAKAKLKPTATVKSAPTDRPTITSPAPRSSGTS